MLKMINDALDGGNLKLAGFVAHSMLSDYGSSGLPVQTQTGNMPLPGWFLKQHIFTLDGNFTTGAVGESDTASTGSSNDAVKCGAFWVRDLVYTVLRPDFLAGSIAKAESDKANIASPNILLKLTIEGMNQFPFNMRNALPIELVARPATLPESCCGLPTGLVLRTCTDLEAVFTLNRALDTAQDEAPTKVVLAFRGLILGDEYATFTMNAALQALRALKVIPGAG